MPKTTEKKCYLLKDTDFKDQFITQKTKESRLTKLSRLLGFTDTYDYSDSNYRIEAIESINPSNESSKKTGGKHRLTLKELIQRLKNIRTKALPGKQEDGEEEAKVSGFFYIWLSDEEYETLKENKQLIALHENTDFNKLKKPRNGVYVILSVAIALSFGILENWGHLPAIILLPGLVPTGVIIYSIMAVLALPFVLYTCRDCIQKIKANEDSGLYALTLLLIVIGYSFSIAMLLLAVTHPVVFLSVGILPLFSGPLGSISALSLINFHKSNENNQFQKKWCNKANIKMGDLAFEKFTRIKKASGQVVNEDISIRDIEVNDVIKVELRQKIPLDGTLNSPEATVSEAHLTGESTPKAKKEGETLLAFSENVGDALELKASMKGEDVLNSYIAAFDQLVKIDYKLKVTDALPDNVQKGEIYLTDLNTDLNKENYINYAVNDVTGQKQIGTIRVYSCEEKSKEPRNTVTNEMIEQVKQNKLTKENKKKFLSITAANGHTKKEGRAEIPSNNNIYYLIFLLIIALIATTLLWYFLGPLPVLHYVLLQCLTIVACFSPSAFALAQLIPPFFTRLFLFQKDISITDHAIHSLRNKDIVWIFDKTGTLTEVPTFSDKEIIEVPDEFTKNDILKMLALVQKNSAKSIYSGPVLYHLKDIKLSDKDTYEATEKKGKRGVSGRVTLEGKKHKTFLCGTKDYIEECLKLDSGDLSNRDYEPLLTRLTRAPHHNGSAIADVNGFAGQAGCEPLPFDSSSSSLTSSNDKTTSYLVIYDDDNNEKKYHYAGWITFDNRLRPDAKETIAKIRSLNWPVYMLTGDYNESAARNMAKEAGIAVPSLEDKPLDKKDKKDKEDKSTKKVGNVYYNCSDKVAIIEEVKKSHPDHMVVMVGDGQNDVDAMRAATVGVAIGANVEASTFADVTLDYKLMDIIHFIEISKRCQSDIESNIRWLLLKTLLSILIASGVFYFILGIHLAPIIALGVIELIGCFTGIPTLLNINASYDFISVKLDKKASKEAADTKDSSQLNWRFIIGLCLIIGPLISLSGIGALLSVPFMLPLGQVTLTSVMAGFVFSAALIAGLVLINLSKLLFDHCTLISDSPLASFERSEEKFRPSQDIKPNKLSLVPGTEVSGMGLSESTPSP